jgi:hypothetical protein
LVAARRDDQPSPPEGDVVDDARVTEERHDRDPCAGFPDPRCLIRARRRHTLTGRVERDGEDLTDMPAKGADLLPCPRIPETRRAVDAATRDHPARRRVRGCRDSRRLLDPSDDGSARKLDDAGTGLAGDHDRRSSAGARNQALGATGHDQPNGLADRLTRVGIETHQ